MHLIPQDRYTRHEVTAPRGVGPSGRTAFRRFGAALSRLIGVPASFAGGVSLGVHRL